ncbi:MAG TPA: hypothetical protein VM290_11540 [Gaiellaceae bacterium]|jgi:type II secretory pathway pseudopilin PulG|nr:hypothetical protein [Gaiellaceae bacterium]
MPGHLTTAADAASGLAGRRWRDLDRRGRAVLLAALAIVAVAGALAVARWPGSVGTVHELTAENRALSETDRAIGARYLDISPEFLFAARELIPEDDTFAVLTGDRVEVATPTTLTALPSYSAYFLLPRRQVADPAAADWVLCYGCEPPPGTEVAWEGADGSILRTER